MATTRRSAKPLDSATICEENGWIGIPPPDPAFLMAKRAQLRNARALIGVSLARLSQESGLSKAEIAQVENLSSECKLPQHTMDRLQHALEVAGVEFLAKAAGGYGVRLKVGS